MKILYLTTSYPIFVRGNWQNVSPRHEQAKRFVKMGHKIFVITPRVKGAKKKETVDGVEIFRFGNNLPLDFRRISIIQALTYLPLFMKKCLEVAREKDVDEIHAFWAIPAGYLGLIASRLLGKPYIVELLGSDIFLGIKNPFTKPFVVSAVNNADYVVADGWSLIEAARKGGCKMKNIFVHSYEPIVADLDKTLLKRLKAKWGIKKGERAIMVSRIKGEIYGAKYALRAMPELLKKVPQVKLLLIGGAGDCLGEINSEIKSLGIEKSVALTGYLEKKEYRCAMETSEAYVSPSLSDSTSVALLEAMAVGMPAVVTNVGDNPHWVKDGENGFVVPARSEKALANALQKLLCSKRIESMRAKAIERISKECTWRIFLGGQDQIYKKVANKTRS